MSLSLIQPQCCLWMLYYLFKSRCCNNIYVCGLLVVVQLWPPSILGGSLHECSALPVWPSCCMFVTFLCRFIHDSMHGGCSTLKSLSLGLPWCAAFGNKFALWTKCFLQNVYFEYVTFAAFNCSDPNVCNFKFNLFIYTSSSTLLLKGMVMSAWTQAHTVVVWMCISGMVHHLFWALPVHFSGLTQTLQ